MTTPEYRARHAAYMRGWNARNRDRVNAAQRLAATKNPDAFWARKINDHAARRGAIGRLTAEDVRATRERDGGKCVFCGIVTTAVDHDMPIVRGGLNVAANLQLCCRPCNRSKARLTGAEFRGEVVGYCPAGHPRTPENRVRRQAGDLCRLCERSRWPKSAAATARATARTRERIAADPAYAERQREYKRAYKMRQRALRERAA